MLHAREDYNRIQDPEGKFGEDEPVFIVRAKDRFSVIAMRAWADATYEMAQETNDTDLAEIAAMVYEHIARVIRYQCEHGSKTPDLP